MKVHASLTKEFGFYVEKIVQGNYIISFYIKKDKLVAVCGIDLQAVRMMGADHVRGWCINPDKKGTLLRLLNLDC